MILKYGNYLEYRKGDFLTHKQALLYFLKAELTDSAVKCSNIDISQPLLEKAFALAKKHSVSHIFANAVLKSGINISDDFSAKLTNSIQTNYVQCVRQEYSLGEIKELLTKEKIRFIPLKGSVIKFYYPDKWMRNSCDIDILIEESNLDKALKALTEKLHYNIDARASHDVSLFLGSVHLELHFQLVENGLANKASDVLGKAWDLSYPKDDSKYEYAMTDELFYFYHIAHMAMHFKGAGCGIRNFMDIWVLNHRVAFDAEKRVALLKEGDLYKFALETKKLSEVWFSGKDYSDLLYDMENYILNSGSYGSRKNRVAIIREKNSSDISYWFFRIFLPYSSMKYVYPILQKYPLLLPIMWVKRWGRILFSNKGQKSIKTELYENRNFQKEYGEQVSALMSKLGL